MKMVLCTLFDSGYLDKGLVLYDSIHKVTNDFFIYVLALDEKCYSVLTALQLAKMIVIHQDDFEDKKLTEIKRNRSVNEYYWTCTPFLVDFVMKKYKEYQCTYIDADMFFYQDPNILLNEMTSAESTTSIIEHRFDEKKINQEMMKRSGRFCVQFNTFTQEKNSQNALEWWKEQCYRCCTVSADGKFFGDQKYLEEFRTRFEKVHILQNMGAGVAPWNIDQYSLVDENSLMLSHKSVNNIFPLVFYHFHQIKYFYNNKVDIFVYARANKTDKKLVNSIYLPYLNLIEKKREFLIQKFNLKYSTVEKRRVKNKFPDLQNVLKRVRQFSCLSLIEFLWFYRNHYKDVIDLSKREGIV